MLAPNRDMIDEMLRNLFSAHLAVTMGALALRQTLLYPPDPAPPWFDVIDSKLKALHARADAWLVTTGPPVIAQLPEALIDYNHHFQTAVDKVKGASRAEALAQVQWLKRAAVGKPQEVDALQRQMDRFAREFHAAKDDLKAAIEKAQEDEVSERSARDALRDQIAEVHKTLSNLGIETDVNLKGVASAGVSVSVALLSYSYLAATAASVAVSPAIPVVGIVVAVASLSYGAFDAAAKSRKVSECFEKLTELKVKLTIEEQRLAALEGIVCALQSAGNAISGMPEALHVKFVWDDINQGLDELISQLEDPETNVATVQDIRSLPFAAKTWGELAIMANNVQKSAAGLSKVFTVELKDPDTVVSLPTPGGKKASA